MISIKPLRLHRYITTSLILLVFLGVAVMTSTYFSKEKTLELNGVERRYRLHLPDGFNKNTNYPLVIALHGFGDSPKWMELYTGLDFKANKENFIVAYPYGTSDGRFSPLSWNGGFCCNFAYESKVDDVAYINALIDELTANYNVNPRRVYVAGFSNGGILASLVASKLGDKLSGVAVVAGSVGGKSSEEEQYTFLDKSTFSVPAIIFHGKNDGSISFNGGESSDPTINFAGAYDTVNYWLDNNSCEKHPSEIIRTSVYTKEVYASCNSGKQVAFYILNNGKHTWPGSNFNLVDLITGKSLSATNAIWDFFKEN